MGLRESYANSRRSPLPVPRKAEHLGIQSARSSWGDRLPMADDDSVTQWMQAAGNGDSDGIQKLWQRFFHQMEDVARKRLPRGRRRHSDEEDVALNAFQKFCAGAAAGKFPQLNDRDDLWRLLLVITKREALQQQRAEGRQKRGGGFIRGESYFGAAPDPDSSAAGLDQQQHSTPTPDNACLLVEEFERLLIALNDDQLRQIALSKMEGSTVEEIAVQMGLSPRSIKRKLQLIRQCWSAPG